MLSRPERSLGLSLHTGLSDNIFCHSPHLARRLHGQAFDFALRNASNISLFEQGVLREFSIADRQMSFTERLGLATNVHADIEGGTSFSPYDLIARMISVKSIQEWLSKAGDLDAIIGFRFHGNMVALLQGLPCYYYVYDSRLTEFCNLYGLPFQDVNDPFVDPVARMLEFDWDTTNRRMAGCYNEIKMFYKENGLTTLLP